ncbi:MAG TPA: glucosamine-6-phosphate deaminase, partial [Thermoanaerobaculia bacterium]|nr:glucosamine-6-phosphate deaminase [Thermoanaerobaculia bacterium]
IPREHPASYYSYMKSHLFAHVDIDPRNVHLPDATAGSDSDDLSVRLEQSCLAYEAAIRKARGLELTFLGLGSNGHIGFNEPGASFDSRTHVVQLAESTRRANARYFRDGVVPEKAITMGIRTILESRRIVLLASGQTKREAVKRLRAGRIDESFPASALHTHGDVTVLVDQAAAG